MSLQNNLAHLGPNPAHQGPFTPNLNYPPSVTVFPSFQSISYIHLLIVHLQTGIYAHVYLISFHSLFSFSGGPCTEGVGLTDTC